MIDQERLEIAVGSALASVTGILRDIGMRNPIVKINVVWTDEPIGTLDQIEMTMALGSSLIPEDFNSDDELKMMIDSLLQSVDDLR